MWAEGWWTTHRLPHLLAWRQLPVHLMGICLYCIMQWCNGLSYLLLCRGGGGRVWGRLWWLTSLSRPSSEPSSLLRRELFNSPHNNLRAATNKVTSSHQLAQTTETFFHCFHASGEERSQLHSYPFPPYCLIWNSLIHSKHKLCLGFF